MLFKEKAFETKPSTSRPQNLSSTPMSPAFPFLRANPIQLEWRETGTAGLIELVLCRQDDTAATPARKDDYIWNLTNSRSKTIS